MTPYKTEGVVLTRDTDTLDLRMRGCEAPRWDQLMGAPAFHVTTEKLPDFPGLDAGPMSPGGLPARLSIEIDGSFDDDGDPTTNPREQAYVFVDLVQDFVGVSDPCTVTVHRVGTLDPVTGPMIVADPGAPIWESGHIVRFELEVLLTDGRLEVAP